EPEFSLYRRHLAAVSADAPRWRSNPSNPLGRLADLDDPEVIGPSGELAVWDEAFLPLATGSWTDRRLEDHHVWRLGSLTKLWACPGIRLGYAVAPDAASAGSLRAVQPRWSVNALALAVLPELLELTDLAEWSGVIRAARVSFVERLRATGAEVTDTDANWVLVAAPRGLRERLVEDHGVLVRDMASFAMPTMVRVALPGDCDVDRVVGAFARTLGGAP
ncbi:MAG: aminotransferase class I/II-fold pyridoxal phosphate-dependent enzyme, partial [Ilumatobacter sp.]